MGREYTVQRGDTLSRIAQREGYDSWEEIYYHADNEAFRQRRPDPNRIYAGDTLILPDRGETPSPAPTEPEPQPPPDDDDDEPSAPEPQPGTASRQTEPSQTRTVLRNTYEVRQIVVAQGIEHRNVNPWMQPQGDNDYRIPRGVQPHFPDNEEREWARIDDLSAEFVSHVQRVRFRLRVIDAKDEYKRALETEGLHVIYMGHSRYGRGQCFGPEPTPGEDWEQGSDTSTRGLFRTGYGVIGVHLSEMRNHGYHFYPVPASTQVRASWRHPHLPRLRRVPLPDDLRERVLPVGQPLADRYWGFRDGEGEGLALWAGWTDTISDPMDLGAADVRCRCWCIFSCTTRLHFWRAVRRWKDWQRTETDHFAYFTTGVSYPPTCWAWLRAVFEYPRRNDFQSWYRSLEWAKHRCTAILRSEGYRYAIY